MHSSVHAHIHIQAYSLMRTHTHTHARIRVRMRMHMNATHTSARAQTRMHPGTRGPNHARTHASAHEHAGMCTHPRRHIRTCTHVHAPVLRTARKHMHAGIRTMHMHVYARARANTPAHVHALVQKHAHIFWLRANRLGPYSSAVSCVYEDLISLWLFGLVCVVSHGHASGGNAGG